MEKKTPESQNNNEEVIRVFIEGKSVQAYRMPLVEPPPAQYSEIKTHFKEEYKNQVNTKLPDPFPDLPEKAKAYLKIGKYGNNIIINKNHLKQLQTFFSKMHEKTIPTELEKDVREHCNLVRMLLNLSSLESVETESYFPTYVCRCNGTKKRVKKKE